MKKTLFLLMGVVVTLLMAMPSFAATSQRIVNQNTMTHNQIVNPTQYNEATNVTVLDNIYNKYGYGYYAYYSTYGSATYSGWVLDNWVFKQAPYSIGVFHQVTGTSTSTSIVDDGTTYDNSVSYAYVDGELQVVSNVTETSSSHTVVTTTTNVVQATLLIEPLLLDINGNKKIETARNEWLPHAPKFYGEYVSSFDLTGDGLKDVCEWVAPSPDAFLVKPEAGKVDSVLQLFGNLGGYANGFDKLSVMCDADKNGKVEGDELNGLALWIDANRDGICQGTELKTLESFNIKSISTHEKGFKGSYETTDGETHSMWAWWPSVK